jgi:2,3-bisphosphoglycerate-dependent phosphoglycerate mutase
VTAIYLVRHGDAVWNPDEMRPLSAQGHKDADAVRDCLAEIPIGAIYSSPYRRARQTVEPLATRLALPIQEVWDFRERTLCAGRVGDFQAATRATWDDFFFAHPGGETNAAAQQRGTSALLEVIARHRGSHVVIATHGTLLALMLRSFDERIGLEFWSAISIPDIYVLTLDELNATSSVHRVWRDVAKEA